MCMLLCFGAFQLLSVHLNHSEPDKVRAFHFSHHPDLYDLLYSKYSSLVDVYIVVFVIT